MRGMCVACTLYVYVGRELSESRTNFAHSDIVLVITDEANLRRSYLAFFLPCPCAVHITSFSGQSYKTIPSMYSYKSNFALVYLRGKSGNDDPIHDKAAIFAKILWVHTTGSAPIHEWGSIFAKIACIVHYTIKYGPIREWACKLCKLRVCLY